MKPNRLLGEKSPYLLQHAHNPVDWYPWGDEAFAKAAAEDKPIFLSIGYSTCYWCHVMEREIFENQAIAEIMNRTVVSIKVDREERPDIDRVYMSALQAMTGSGGWPLSMFLTLDRKPFWGATYIPPVSLHGRVGFGDVLARIHEVWISDRNAILETGERVTEHLRDLVSTALNTAVADEQILDRGFDSFSKSYDTLNAGFGHAPKFPRPVAFSFLFRYNKRTGNKQALNVSLETLRAMYGGGVYDHVGGGFHRYATDAEWHVPHFEKMLYDQAQLVVSYLEAFQITGENLYAEAARDVLAYVRREMTHSAGAFYSAQDAESALSFDGPAKKKEGAFYTWTEKELKEILPAEQLRVVQLYYGTRDSGNVRADPHGEFAGLNILHIVKTREDVAKELQMSAKEVGRILVSSRSTLIAARSKRPRPHLDDKILVSWNGLMISAFARAAQVLEDKDYAAAAVRAARFVLDTMDDTIVLKRRFRDGDARIKAQLVDYAFLIQGLIDLYEATSDVSWLKKALALTERMIDLFYDADNGGFFDASTDEPLLVRTKEYYDGAEPTGNSVAILSLLRLAQMTDNKRYDQVARESLQYFADKMAVIPEALPQFLAALDFSLTKPMQIVIAGRQDSADTMALLNEVHRRFIPNKVLLFASNDLASIAPFLKEMGQIGGRAAAYVCENYSCQLPVTEPQQLAVLLNRHGQQKSPIRS